jgi:thiol-disulfide isomerase/thioredoxin
MKIDKATIITLLVIGVVLLLMAVFMIRSGFLNGGVSDSTPADNLQRVTKEVEFYDLTGNKVTLADFAGKYVLVNVWASWSPFSKDELTALDSLASEYKDRVVVLAINRAEAEPQVRAYLKTLPELSTLTILRDPTDFYYDFIGGYSMPETIFYDKKGSVVRQRRGAMNIEEMRSITEELLNTSN